MVTAAEDMMTVRDIAAHLKLAQATVQRWCRDRTLPVAKIGKEYRIRQSDLDAWFVARRDGRL